MIQSNTYVDLQGREYSIAALDPQERALIEQLRNRARAQPDWNDFENYWTDAVWNFFKDRGLTRREARRTVAYRIAQDLAGRLAIKAGLARAPDYRDELEELIRTQFKTRREFCRATGLSEDMLSHVLARRKHLSLETLTEALSHIGYTLRIAPIETRASDS